MSTEHLHTGQHGTTGAPRRSRAGLPRAGRVAVLAIWLLLAVAVLPVADQLDQCRSRQSWPAPPLVCAVAIVLWGRC